MLRLLHQNTEWRLFALTIKKTATFFTSNHIIDFFFFAPCFDLKIPKYVVMYIPKFSDNCSLLVEKFLDFMQFPPFSLTGKIVS